MAKLGLFVFPTLLLVCLAQPEPAPDGARLFAARCAPCHGSDGAGGERGPGIVDVRHAHHRTEASLREVIRNGIPDAGMPPFSLPQAQINVIAAYVMSLRVPAVGQRMTGDIVAGERFFFGAGGCYVCHMIGGRGGIVGPDLSTIGHERTLTQIEKALRHPETLNNRGYRPVTVHLTDGRTLTGAVKNQSNYDLQLQTLDGMLHLVNRSQVASEQTQPKSLMPAVTADAATMNDLLAFMVLPPAHSQILLPREPAGAFDEIAEPKLGNWTTYHGRLGGNRYSSLTQINTGNVAGLAPRWMFPVPNARKLEVTPLVVDGIMYVTAANQAFALDACTGREIWHYERPLTKGVIGDAGGAINRGAAILGDRLFMVTDHAHLIALNRFGGQLLWDTEMADYRQHYGATSAPLVVNDLVVSGTSGGDEGARGFIAAYRASTGERVWRLWAMPAKPGDPQSETWAGRAMEHGCATAWLTGTYDPETGLIYWPTGNPCPDFNGDERKGDNLYANSVLALEPATGKLRWYFQFTPHDVHDWDATETPMLIDAEFRGRRRKLLVQANRNGFFYVLDGVTGEFLLGEPFVHKLTWASGIGRDGRPKVLPGSDPTPQGTRTCPAIEGATNWMSTAYNPQTRLFYVMALESCSIYTKSSAWWEPGKSFYGGGTSRVPGETSQKVLRALDLETGSVAWEYPQTGSGSSWGGVLATAGDLVIFDDDSGALAAADARSGKALWHFHTNELWRSSPMTYAVDGRQYIAVSAGSEIIAFSLP